MNPDELSLEQLIKLLKNMTDEQIELIDRDKNVDFRLKHNISLTEEKEIIRHLDKKDYRQGPIDDDNPNRKHPLWIFIKEIKKINCYIKLKIINKCKVAIIISFHEAEHQLQGKENEK